MAEAPTEPNAGPTSGFLRDTLRNATGSLILFSARFVALAVIARTLGVEAFGVVALAILSADLMVMLLLAGLPGVIVRFLPILNTAARPEFRVLRRRWLLASAGLLILVAPLVGYLVLDLTGGLIVLFACWVVAGAVQAASLAEIQGAMRFDLVVWSLSLGALALLMGAVLVVLVPTLASAFVALGAAPLAQLLPWFMLARHEARLEGTAQMPSGSEIIRYGTNVCVIAALTAIVWSRGELFVVEARLGETTLGHYGAAVTLTAMVWRLTGLLQGAVTPHLSRRLQTEQGVGPFLADMTRLTMTIAGIAALGIALFGFELVNLIFGVEYAPAGALLAVMAPGIAMAGVTTVTLGVQLMSNARVPRNALICGAISLLGLAWFMSGWFGAEGAATARMLTMCGVAVAMPLWLIWKGSGPLGKQILLELCGTILLVAAGSAISLFADLGFVERALLWLVVSYGVLVRATGAWTPPAMMRQTLGMLRAL
ncbi:MAG: lipopolysaccharide biosynthesis protein [Paracoccaceae bacterium]